MRRYNVILINLNSLPGLDVVPIFPIGPVYVSSFLQQVGVNVKMVDFFLQPDYLETLEYLNEDFDCIAFSIRNIDTLELDAEIHLPNYRRIMNKIVSKAKEINPSTLVLIGGGGYAVYSEGLEKYLPFDFGVKGNVEENLFEIISNHIQTLQDDIRLIENFSMFDMKFDKELVQTYLKLGSTQIGLPTRCGGRCPLKCTYCSYSKIDSKTNLLRPLSNLRNDILNLYEMGVREVFFTDSLFNISLSHAKSICRMIMDLNLPDFKWFAYAKPTTDKEFIELAARSGCQSLMVSFDTFSPVMLKRLRKSFSVKQAIEFINYCREWNLTLIGLLLFGGPQENEDTIRESCEFVNEHFKNGELFYSFGMRLLPGSKLAEISGIPEDELLFPAFWPFDEACFDYVIKHLDNSFFSFNRLARISNWRKGYHKLKPHLVEQTGITILKRSIEV